MDQVSLTQIDVHLYLFYLAYKFIKPAQSEEATENKNIFTFWDGVAIQLLNPKGMVMLVLMFSLFSSPEASSVDVLKLVVWLCILNVSAHLLWVAFGSHILSRFSSGRSERTQAIFYASCLSLVGLWVLYEVVVKIIN